MVRRDVAQSPHGCEAGGGVCPALPPRAGGRDTPPTPVGSGRRERAGRSPPLLPRGCGLSAASSGWAPLPAPRGNSPPVCRSRQGTPAGTGRSPPPRQEKKIKRKKKKELGRREIAAGSQEPGEVPSRCAAWRPGFSFALLFAKLSRVPQAVRCQLETAACKNRLAQTRALKHLLMKEQAFPHFSSFFFFATITAGCGVEETWINASIHPSCNNLLL